EAPALFLFRDVEKKFEDQRAVTREMPLEGADIVEPVFPDVPTDEPFWQILRFEQLLVDAHCQDFFVVRAVEDADAAGSRQALRDAPEKIVLQLLGARLAEGVNLDALRIEPAHHVLDDA